METDEDAFTAHASALMLAVLINRLISKNVLTEADRKAMNKEIRAITKHPRVREIVAGILETP